MAVTATPAFAQALRCAMVQMSTANTNRDGTGTLSSAVAAGSNGTIVDCIIFKAIVTTAAGTLRIFYSDDSGTTYRLLAEVTTAGATVSGTVKGEEVTWVPPGGVPFKMPSTGRLKFCPHNSETWNVFVEGEDL